MRRLELKSVSASWNLDSPLSGFSRSRSVSLAADRGSWLYISGLNGVGKSTLLQALAGGVPFVAGSLLVDSLEVALKAHEARFPAQIQAVPQHSRFDSPIALSDAVALMKAARPALFNEAALDDLASRFASLGLISSGFFVSGRLFDLFSAISSVPRILLLDEIGPESGLSQNLRSQDLYDLVRWACPHATVLFTEHDVTLGLQLADQVLWLQHDTPPLLFDAIDSESSALIGAALHQDLSVADEGEREGANTYALDVLRLDRPIREQITLAVQAASRSRLGGRSRESVLAAIIEDFPFLGAKDYSETLSGGQRVVIRWFLLNFAGTGHLPASLLGHLDASNRSKIRRWELVGSLDGSSNGCR